MQQIDLLEAAACLWEAFLNRHRSDDERATGAVYMWGYAHVRLTVVSWAGQVQDAWSASPDHDRLSFDWDFVPEWLNKKLNEPNLYD